MKEQDFFDLLNKYGVPYRVTPKNIKVKCPFHNDHEESMSIKRDKLFWRCFMDGNEEEGACCANEGVRYYQDLKNMLEFMNEK